MAAALALLLPVAAGAADGIVEVLHRSHEMRLQALRAARGDGNAGRILRASFDAVRRSAGDLPGVASAELRVVGDDSAFAETLDGRVVVVNESLADASESARRFVLAHELGHVALGHWSQMGRLFRQWIPGAVTPEHTRPVAALLGRDASRLAHAQEYEADAFAADILARLGGTPADVHAVFDRLGVDVDTATHPARRKRLAALQGLSD